MSELARLLGDQAYFTGKIVSLADLLLAAHAAFLPGFAEGRELLAPHANLTAWLARTEARPSLRATTWERVAEGAKVV